MSRAQAARVEQDLARRAALGHVDLRLARLGERIGRADARRAARRAPRARRGRSSASSTIPGRADAVHEPEADDRARAAHELARVDLVALAARRCRRSTRRPNGASAARRRRRRPRRPPSRRRRRPACRRWPRSGAPSGPSGSESIATSAPSSRARSRLACVEASAITRPAPIGRPSWTASDPTPPAAATIDHRLAGPTRARRAVQVPGGQALDEQRQRRAVVDAVGDREGQRLGRGRVLGVAAGAAERDDALRRCPRARPRPRRPGPAAAAGPRGSRCGAGGCRRSSSPRARPG